ncbi:hypothetical protein C2U55_14785 [Enterobacteriaceae bacterium ENNIH3]|nr:hypothetical protein C2U55_14785 [Enterobacteriaceae bacterium ENNIH3]AUV09661.1 hypothetical protein C2U52_27110 [Enterobacteriaceae bacterium ENNIH2]
MNEKNLQLLEGAIPAFLKRFSLGVRSYKDDKSFKLHFLVITKLEGSIVHFDYEYTGQCTLWPGHGKHSGKVDFAGTHGPDDLLNKIDAVITQSVEESYNYVR